MGNLRIYFDVAISLIVAAIAYYFLDSTGVVEKEGFKITGGITVYFLNFILMHKFHKSQYNSNSDRKISGVKVLEIEDRDKYQKTIVENIKSAKSSIVMIMRSLRSSSESSDIQDEVAKIRNALKTVVEESNDSISILVVTGSNEEYLKDSYQLRKISKKVNVYFSKTMRTSDMSVVLVDNQILVIGFARKAAKPEDRSKKWIKGDSISLSNILAQHANKLKESSTGYDEYLGETVKRIMPENQDNIDSVSKLLGLPKDEIRGVSLKESGSEHAV